MAQTRPSAIVQRPDPERAVSECTVAELLTEVIERAKLRRASSNSEWSREDEDARNRELSVAITSAEDCLTRHNKAVYMERGVFAITDAERIPEA